MQQFNLNKSRVVFDREHHTYHIGEKDERCFSLADIKTTSKVHEDNVRLQLSIYAYLFELNNPDCYVDRLFCLWLPKPQYGEGEIYEVKRVSTELCKAIIEAYVKGLEGLDFAEMIRNELKKN